jgi:hypothetical protein
MNNIKLNNLAFWDLVRLTYFGKIIMLKDKKIKISLITDIFPYEEGC